MSTSQPGFVSHLLRRPLAFRVRRTLRDVWWRVRETQVHNPPLPTRLSSILFVCKGNICRSPFAAERATRLLAEAGAAHVRCQSAGILPSQSGECPADAVAAAAPFGISLDGHRAVALTEALITAHDLIVVMEARQLIEMRRRWPAHRSLFVLLPLVSADSALERGAFERLNIEDPFGRGSKKFEECYRRIDESVRELITRIASPSRASGK